MPARKKTARKVTSRTAGSSGSRLARAAGGSGGRSRGIDKREMIRLLNGDIQHELRAALTYLYQHATAPGLKGQTLRQVIGPEILGELQHAILLADKVVALGGQPDLTVLPIDRQETVEEMIRYDLKLEDEAVANYSQCAAQADRLGDLGLKVQLENLASEETNHRDMLERLGRDIGDR